MLSMFSDGFSSAHCTGTNFFRIVAGMLKLMSNSGFLFFRAPAAKSGNEGFCSASSTALSFAFNLVITSSNVRIVPLVFISSKLICIQGNPWCQSEPNSTSLTVTCPFVAMSAMLSIPFIQKCWADSFRR